jgi:hypothetical protein
MFTALCGLVMASVSHQAVDEAVVEDYLPTFQALN